MRMCAFCESIANTNEEYVYARYKGGDFIFKDNGEYGILIDTGDSGCLGTLNDIKYCPFCGRELRSKESESN